MNRGPDDQGAPRHRARDRRGRAAAAQHRACGDAARRRDVRAVTNPGGEWRSYGGDYSNTRNQSLETTITPAKVPTLEPAFRVLVESGRWHR